MAIDLKNIHIGHLIEQRVLELEIESSRICNFFKCSLADIEIMYKQKSIDSDILLGWSKLLEYDFFRIYTQNLILYAPQSNKNYNILTVKKKTSLPQFRKKIYTKEIIYFILELERTKQKTKAQIIIEYDIPKTTLYKWISKYGNEELE